MKLNQEINNAGGDITQGDKTQGNKSTSSVVVAGFVLAILIIALAWGFNEFSLGIGANEIQGTNQTHPE